MPPTGADDDIVLLGVASSGTVEQWDGVAARVGVLLRWFHRPEIGFPDYGYDVYRAKLSDVPPLWFDDPTAQALGGQNDWSYVGEVDLHSDAGFRFAPIGPNRNALVVAPQDKVELRFPDPAWYLRLDPGLHGPDVQVELWSGGVQRAVHHLKPGGPPVEAVTRGVERVVLSGDGSLASVAYRLLTSRRQWTHLAHLCLPVRDPGYQCGPLTGATEEDEARSRVPAGVQAQWSSRYQQGFADLLPVLRRIATNKPASPLPASTDPAAPSVDADERAALQLAGLDPHIARIVGLAYDAPFPQGLDGAVYSYRVVGRWRGRRASIALGGASLSQLARSGVKLSGGATLRTGSRGIAVTAASGKVARPRL